MWHYSAALPCRTPLTLLTLLTGHRGLVVHTSDHPSHLTHTSIVNQLEKFEDAKTSLLSLLSCHSLPMISFTCPWALLGFTGTYKNI